MEAAGVSVVSTQTQAQGAGAEGVVLVQVQGEVKIPPHWSLGFPRHSHWGPGGLSGVSLEKADGGCSGTAPTASSQHPLLCDTRAESSQA